jgi:hypothetical protein
LKASLNACLAAFISAAVGLAPSPARAAACAGGTATACGVATGVTYNGAALTFAGAATNGTVRTEIWYLLAPPAGSHNVVVTAPVATDVTASSISFTGVNQSTPLGTLVSAIGTGATPTVTANTILGEPVVDIMGAVGSTTPTVSGATQTLRNTNTTVTGLSPIVSGNSTAFGQATPVTMSWTIPSADWAIAAVPIKASTALTGVDVDSFTATWRDDHTQLQWRSGYQPKTVGFSVYRSNGASPKTLLNKDLIPGGALAGTLSSFSWTDSTPGWNGDVSYWLAETKQDGSTLWYGPASPVPPVATPPAPPSSAATPDGGIAPTPTVTGAAGLGGFTGPAGFAGTPGSPESTSAPQSGCTIVAPGDSLGGLRLFLLAGVVWSTRRRRRGWVLPALFLAVLFASSLWAPRRAAATGGVSVDATATAHGASGLTFAHVMGAGSNGLLVVGVVTPIVCTNTTADSGNCGACGATCSLDTSSLSTGLLSLWHLDEGTGTTTVDSSGNGNTASLINGPAWTTGYSQKAVQGNGTGYVQGLIGTWFGGNNPLTATAWVYATATTNGPVFGVTSTQGWNMPFLSINGSTVYGYVWQNPIISTTVTLNAWHLLSLTYNPTGTIATLYVDGVSKGTSTGIYQASGVADYWTTNIAGSRPGGVNSILTGRVDEIRAYNRILSGAELTALTTARLACSGSTCAACGSGKANCSGNCLVVTGNDNANCGACGHTCNTAQGETCSSGTCVCSNGSLTDCSTYCVDPVTDTNNCGGCGNVCGMPTPTSVDAGLLGHWTLNDNTGATALDSSGNSRNATLLNSPTWLPGYSGSGLSFNGASSYMTASLGTYFGQNNKLSASAWVYATATTNGPIFGVSAIPAGQTWNMPFLSIAGPTVHGWLWQVNGNNWLTATVSLNAWHHLAITYDPAVGEKFYVDGAFSSSGTGTYLPSFASDTLTTNISGAKPTDVTNSVLNGEIDDVRAYTRVLSAAEVAMIYNARQSCASSLCGGCGGGESTCSAVCTDKNNDPGNCGTCGNTCNTAGGQACLSGTCGCSVGTSCSSVCVDTTTDNNNCGTCGNACGTTTCASCSQGMLGWWHLDEGTGTMSADASGSLHPATLSNSPTWTTAGQSGDALTFTAPTSYLAANIGTWFGGNHTLSAAVWVYTTATTSGPVFGVTNAAGGGSWDMPFLSVYGATVYGWLWQVNGNTPLQATVSLNAWHLLAVTYDPAVGEKFYVDGALSGTGTGTYAPSGVTDYWTTYIPGAKPANVPAMNDHFNGTLDEARAYGRVLSAGEIKLLYDARQSCGGSSCNACPAGTTLCGSTCTNTQADAANCNACGTACAMGQTCVSGACM